jgi:TM2 domain-containing membrane protein YozV
MKTFLFTLIVFMMSTFILLAQNDVTKYPIKERFNQRIILEPTQPTPQSHRENLTAQALLNEMPTLHVALPQNIVENTSIPFLWKQATPNMDMNLQAMYLTDHKDPAIACTMSLLLPGLGQLYNGETGKGIAFIATSYGGLAVGAIALSTHNDGLATVGFVTAAVSYLWSILDASITSGALNRHHELVDISLNGNNHLSLQPSVSSLHDTKGNYLPKSTNAGFAVAYAFGDK